MEEENTEVVMVTVATFPEAIEAHIYRNRLEVEGIPCVLGDENIISNQPWHSIAYGGVKLRVRQQDKENARAIIAEIRDELQPTMGVVGACPVCASPQVQVEEQPGIFKKLLSFILADPLRNHILVCGNCGHTWRP
ncbi:DUF2007 domain-containing protein [Adhaeribacter aquaticus]|uniref:putative signal transducing protein n=1 Tax=Adhaeribacter aquaticus TaxID=299567 RepID=UPI0004097F3B|nr:DUF2007 domain-containing protein [Adhaeribacter aquaticus]